MALAALLVTVGGGQGQKQASRSKAGQSEVSGRQHGRWKGEGGVKRSESRPILKTEMMDLTELNVECEGEKGSSVCGPSI